MKIDSLEIPTGTGQACLVIGLYRGVPSVVFLDEEGSHRVWLFVNPDYSATFRQYAANGALLLDLSFDLDDEQFWIFLNRTGAEMGRKFSLNHLVEILQNILDRREPDES